MRGLLLLIPFFILIFHNEYSFCQEKAGISTVVIDAGHGGKDPGALGKYSQEKKITLGIALKLGNLIKENFPGVKVIYTRSTDNFVELHERASIANRNKADLFISIHCNANRSHTFHGAETYVMGLHKTEANLSIAKMENSSILMEPDYQSNYEGFDPNSDESYITFTLFQNVYLDQSTEFASIIQENLTSGSGLGDRGVRQAGFMVLYKTTMPSVLVETGFLSNAEEEKFLSTEKGQQQIAKSIFRAFKVFKGKMEGTLADTDSTSEIKMKNTEAPVKEKNTSVLAVPSKNGYTSTVKNNTAIASKKDEIYFAVQFAMYPKEVPLSSKKFSGLEDVRMYRHKGMYKYTSGVDASLDTALARLGEIKKKGYADAFVVAFHGKERITIEEARKLLEGSLK